MTNFSGKNLDRSAGREAVNSRDGVNNKGSGFKIEMSQSGNPSVFEASNGKLSISVPISLKRRSGRQLITLPDGKTHEPRPWDTDPTPLQIALARGHCWLAISRPAISEKRLAVTANGQVRYELKTPYRNGTTHVIFEPLDFMAKLAALVPKPRVNLTRLDSEHPYSSLCEQLRCPNSFQMNLSWCFRTQQQTPRSSHTGQAGQEARH